MSGEGPPRDLHARGAEPRLEEVVRARGGEADTPTVRAAKPAKEVEANQPLGGQRSGESRKRRGIFEA